MQKGKGLLLIVGFFLASLSMKGQDMHFSQFYQSPLNLNPALTGAFDGNMRGVVNYKNQWNSIAKPYQTVAASFEMSFLKHKWEKGYITGGLSFFGDRAGDANLGTNQANLSVGSHVYISSKQTISAGLQAGYAQRSVDFDELKWGSQYDGINYNPNATPGEPSTLSNVSHPDFAAGLQWNYGKSSMYATANNEFSLNAGVSMFHINQPSLSFYQTPQDDLPYKFMAHAGSFIGVANTNMAVIPSVMAAMQGPHNEILAGARLRYQLKKSSKYTGFVSGTAVSFGGHYRVGDSFIAETYLEMGSFGLGVSYDINVSGLTTATNGRGGLEVSFRYINPNPMTAGDAAAPRL